MPVKKFLLWNINRKPLEAAVADLAYKHDVDLIILIESKVAVATMLRVLNSKAGRDGFHLTEGVCAAVTIFSRFSRAFIQPVYESRRISIRKITLPSLPEILLAAVHLPSKLHNSDASQVDECTALARRIQIEEDRAGHCRTVLLGDFNMNPFESGFVAAGGLNSVMSRRIAARKTRKVQEREYRFFIIQCGITLAMR